MCFEDIIDPIYKPCIKIISWGLILLLFIVVIMKFFLGSMKRIMKPFGLRRSNIVIF